LPDIGDGVSRNPRGLSVKKAQYSSVERIRLNAQVTATSDDNQYINTWSRPALRTLIRDANELEPASGAARISPSSVPAGRRRTIRLEYVVGAKGLSPGGRLALLLPQMWGGQSSSHDIGVFAVPGATGVSPPIVGDKSGNPCFAPDDAGNYKFNLLVDCEGNGSFRRIAPYPSIDVLGDVAVDFRVTGPAVAEPDGRYTLKITPVDRHMNRASVYNGSMQILIVGENRIPAEEVDYVPENGRDGTMFIRDLPPLEKGVSSICAVDSVAGIVGLSNPIYCGTSFGADKVFFGDIHCHSELSDGTGDADDAYTFSRDVMHNDFGALADHFQFD
jgi:hypothetical protein